MYNLQALPFISICIPAYKRPENFRRLLESIARQNFRDFEVIVTDDSPDESVYEVLKLFPKLPVVYHKNSPSLGTPANWNSGLKLARGEWIKIMHDDDWFANSDSLSAFAERAREKRSLFIISGYQKVFDGQKTEKAIFPAGSINRIVKNPLILLSDNVIGPPSVVLVHRSIEDLYDERMKWRVDIDYYVRIINRIKSIERIDHPLINVGISESQVTNYCINVPEVELPEGSLMLDKYGTRPLKNILVYDAWWRILRNVGVRNAEDLHKHVSDGWPEAVLKMVEHQKKIPSRLLRNGLVSKFAMGYSYLRNFRNL